MDLAESWDKTLNLPKTEFPMRAGLPKKEPEILRMWDEMSLYKRVLALRESGRRSGMTFILHDGPPYANGDIHVGTAMNKILKDIVVKYRLMSGYYTPYVPGWDTHGLPTEQEVIKRRGLDRRQVEPLEWRRMCKEFAETYLSRQRDQFKRLGCIGDWERPYATFDPAYEAREIEVIGEIAERGLLYRGKRAIYYCAHCETALAEAEIEYREHLAPSLYVVFPLKGSLSIDGESYAAQLVIWTTTPWTLPANVAVAVKGGADYGLYATDNGNLVVAKALADDVREVLKSKEWKELAVFKGDSLKGLKYGHPFYPGREGEFYEMPSAPVFAVILEDFVDMSTGSGAVHIAPGHGEEDFQAGLRWGLPAFCPVDDRGQFAAGAGVPDPIVGMLFENANPVIVRLLKEKGALLATLEYMHNYPHCWRCKNPVVYRATDQWFLDVDAIRKALAEAAEGIAWHPDFGRSRQKNMLLERPDWCLSRQRIWGVPLPFFQCVSCEAYLVSRDVIRRVAEVVRQEGSDAWWRYDAGRFLGSGELCPACGKSEFRKERDIVDVWFDSGVSHFAVLQQTGQLEWPATLYLEGSDQYRGWFQTSLITSVAVTGKPMTRQIVQHGFAVDEEGRKMSKSIGNVVDPQEVIQKYGAEILRLWVAASDFTEDVRVSSAILGKTADEYRKIRNTIRFLLGNLWDYEPAMRVPRLRMRELDRWALARWYEVLARIREGFENYDFAAALRRSYEFCESDLSAFFLDVLKTRLYTSPAGSEERRSAQTALAQILETLIPALAPVLSFTAEEAWQHLPFRNREVLSVFMADFPRPDPEWQDEELLKKWEVLRGYRNEVNRSIEDSKEKEILKTPAEAVVCFYGDEAHLAPLKSLSAADLQEAFNVAFVHLRPIQDLSRGLIEPMERTEGLVASVEKTKYPKCARCWRHDPTVGDDANYETICALCVHTVTAFGNR
jgi:isoleucyl-tRNA synthetase